MVRKTLSVSPHILNTFFRVIFALNNNSEYLIDPKPLNASGHEIIVRFSPETTGKKWMVLDIASYGLYCEIKKIIHYHLTPKEGKTAGKSAAVHQYQCANRFPLFLLKCARDFPEQHAGFSTVYRVHWHSCDGFYEG